MNDQTEEIPVYVDPPAGDHASRNPRPQARTAADRSESPAAVDSVDAPTELLTPVTELLPPVTESEPGAGRRRRRAAGAATAAAAVPTGLQRRAMRMGSRVMAAASAVIVVTGTGFAYYTEKSVNNGFTHMNVIPPGDNEALGDDMNILLIGLDTRKDQNGNDLPKDILDQLHAGDGEEGGYNANSLILVHIPKDMSKITAFSIPRDDYVPVTGIPGYDHAKIKESYGLAKFYAEQKLQNQGMTDKVQLEHLGREAGQKSVVQTVKAVTGVPINRVAEVSLVGFYDLAKILGGVDVCLNHAVDDSFYSGADFPAGPQHLDAAQALSFVRQRHELENGDLDRTHRQQAFLTSIAKQLKSSGTLTNISRLQQLITAAQQDIVLSDGWNVLDFAQKLGKMGKTPIEFQTLPVKAYDTVDGQDVNVVDLGLIRNTVRTAFGMQTDAPVAPKSTPTSTVDVVNAGAEGGTAGKLSTALAQKGFTAGDVDSDTSGDYGASTIYYGSGADTDAGSLSDMLNGIPAVASKNVAAGHVKVVLSSDFSLPEALGGAPATTTSAAPTTTSGPAAAGETDAPSTDDGQPDSGQPVTTNFGDTIPCVN